MTVALQGHVVKGVLVHNVQFFRQIEPVARHLRHGGAQFHDGLPALGQGIEKLGVEPSAAQTEAEQTGRNQCGQAAECDLKIFEAECEWGVKIIAALLDVIAEVEGAHGVLPVLAYLDQPAAVAHGVDAGVHRPAHHRRRR